MPLQFLQQQDLVDVVAGQPIRGRDQDQVKAAGGGAIAQAAEARTPQGRAAVAVIADDLIGGHVPALLPGVPRQTLHLLLDRLGLRLTLRRYPDIKRHSHGHPPARRDRATRRQARLPDPPSRSAPPGRPGPSGVGRPDPAASSDVRSTGIASVPPVRRASAEAALARMNRSRSDRRDQLSRRRVRRTRQNLSFAIRPSSRTIGASKAATGPCGASSAPDQPPGSAEVTTSSATSSVSAPALTSTFPPIAAGCSFSGGPWPCWASWKPLDHASASTRHGRYLLARTLTEPARGPRRGVQPATGTSCCGTRAAGGPDGTASEDPARGRGARREGEGQGHAGLGRAGLRCAAGDRGARISGADALTPTPVLAHAMRTDSGRPSSSMRFRARTAMATSVARPGSVRDRSASPITRL
jgi:hypothetical protein